MTKQRLYEAGWSWNQNTERVIRRLCIGETLNFPCGMSNIGNVRADLDPKVKPDIIADLRRPLDHFKPHQFDTVLCDAPFSFYGRMAWIMPIADLCRRRLILCTPPVDVKLSRKYWRKRYFITEQGSMMLRIWQVFDKNELPLEVEKNQCRLDKI